MGDLQEMADMINEARQHNDIRKLNDKLKDIIPPTPTTPEPKPVQIVDLVKYSHLFPACTHYFSKTDVMSCRARFGLEKEKWCTACLHAEELKEVFVNYEELKKVLLAHLRDEVLHIDTPLMDSGNEELWYRATNEK